MLYSPRGGSDDIRSHRLTTRSINGNDARVNDIN